MQACPALHLAKLKAVYPALSGVGIGGLWAGWIDLTPDSVPVISPVEALPGFIPGRPASAATGLGSVPGAGQLAADLVAGDRPSVDPAAFSFSRLDRAAQPQPGMM